MFTVPVPFFVATINPRSRIRRALRGSELVIDKDRVYARNLEVPAGGGVGTARAIARAYGVFATGGKELGLREETLRQLMAPPVAPRPNCQRCSTRLVSGSIRNELQFERTLET